eukprot:GILJ01001479.1.p1 GENE.GILJ01001479.1~~GILJ01001479.1.p1  ORF type:complete len:399 (-),score=50.51 GILJ01001479.1:94-1260(-)
MDDSDLLAKLVAHLEQVSLSGERQSLPKHLFEGRFAVLKEYFEGITFDDLEELALDDILALAETRHRVLMKIFLNKELAPLLCKRRPPFAGYEPLQDTTPPPIQPSFGLVNLSNRVLPSRFPFASKDTPTIEVIISEVAQWNDADKMSCVKLDLSSNRLLDEDMLHVFNLLDCFPAVKFVNLFNNHFFGMDPELKDMLDGNLKRILARQTIEYVDITKNPLATSDRRDFFRNLSIEHLKKLIWIPRQWYLGQGWTVIVDNDPLHVNIIMESHDSYYQSAACFDGKYIDCSGSIVDLQDSDPKDDRYDFFITVRSQAGSSQDLYVSGQQQRRELVVKDKQINSTKEDAKQVISSLVNNNKQYFFTVDTGSLFLKKLCDDSGKVLYLRHH